VPHIDGLAVKSRVVVQLVIVGDMCPQAARSTGETTRASGRLTEAMK
jgi:hypothetical protein